MGLPAKERVDERREIVRLGVSSAHGEKGLARALKLLWWFMVTYREYSRKALVSVSAHTVWTLPLAWCLARRRRALLAYLPHELESESGAATASRRWLARLLERMLIPHCDIMCVVNGSIASWYGETYGTTPLCVRNIPLDSRPHPHLRARLGLDRDDMLFIHTGHLIANRNIPRILETFESQSTAHVVFLGGGALADTVDAASRRCPTIHRLPPVPHDEVVGYVREADVALVLIEPTCLSYRLASPNKLFEALAAGTPPLCTDLPEARGLLADQSDTWILESVPQLAQVVHSISKADTDRFNRGWHGLPSWAEEVRPLVGAYCHQLRVRNMPCAE